MESAPVTPAAADAAESVELLELSLPVPVPVAPSDVPFGGTYGFFGRSQVCLSRVRTVSCGSTVHSQSIAYKTQSRRRVLAPTVNIKTTESVRVRGA